MRRGDGMLTCPHLAQRVKRRLRWGIALLAISSVTAPEPVYLGAAADYAILSEGAINSPAGSVIRGDVGSAYGRVAFDPMVLDASTDFYKSTQISGKAYDISCSPPTQAMLVAAVTDMEAAYDDAAARPISASANLNVM
jgi:hypothetical protein